MRLTNPCRFVSILLVSLLVALGSAQGGSQGGFQGNQGGNQGNQGGQQETSYPPRNLNNGIERGIWDSKNAILTPGDKVEWKLKGVPGQTIFATVRTDVFDPVLKIVDSKGKVLAENDDQYEGNQAPFLAFTFADDKEYKLVVQNYRSAAGGRFDLFTQTFTAVDLKLGENKVPVKVPERDEERLRRTYVRFKATAGTVYALPRVTVGEGNRVQYLQPQMIIGPTGIYKDDFFNYRPTTNGPLFEAKKAGDFYVVYSPANGSGNLVARLDTVEVRNVDKVGAIKAELPPMGQLIVKYKVERGDIIRRQVSKQGNIGFSLDLTSLPENGEKPETQPIGNANESVRFYKPQFTDNENLYMMHTASANAMLIFAAGTETPGSITLNQTMDIPTWQDGIPAEGQVGLGETKFYTISGKKGDIQRLGGTAQGFELEFQLINMDGEATTFIDKYNHRPGHELRYSENEKFLVAVSSPGTGGSGTYKMTLNAAKPERITLGTIATYTDGPSFGTYAVDLEKGVQYQLTSADVNTNITLIDDQGNVVPVAALVLAGKRVIYIGVGKTGTFKIKIESGTQGSKFRVDKTQLPDLG